MSDLDDLIDSYVEKDVAEISMDKVTSEYDFTTILSKVKSDLIHDSATPLEYKESLNTSFSDEVIKELGQECFNLFNLEKSDRRTLTPLGEFGVKYIGACVLVAVSLSIVLLIMGAKLLSMIFGANLDPMIIGSSLWSVIVGACLAISGFFYIRNIRCQVEELRLKRREKDDIVLRFKLSSKIQTKFKSFYREIENAS